MIHDSSSRIVQGLREWIDSVPPGTQLPSSRQLVQTYAASPVTVQRALRSLNELGLVESRPGVGSFVRRTSPPRPHDYSWQTAALGPRSGHGTQLAAALRAASADAYDLGSGFPHAELLPESLLRQAFTRAARSRATLAWPSAAGIADLRAWFAAELAQSTVGGSAPVASDVVIFPGSQSGLAAAFRALAGPGEPLLIESPTYWGAILAAAGANVELVPIPSSAAGPDPADVERAFRETGARAFYAQPSFANPTGALWPAEVRRTVLEIVQRCGAFLIEDDWAHDFALSESPAPVAAHDDGGHVIYVRSLTKSVSPSVRVAGVIARGPIRERLLHTAQAESVYVSAALQSVALDVVTQPGWSRHLRRVQDQLIQRRDLLAASLREHAPAVQLDSLPAGGLHLWVRLPDAIELDVLVPQLAAEGVSVVPGTELFPAEPTAPYLRLTFAGPDPGSYPEAAKIISAAVDRQLN